MVAHLEGVNNGVADLPGLSNPSGELCIANAQAGLQLLSVAPA